MKYLAVLFFFGGVSLAEVSRLQSILAICIFNDPTIGCKILQEGFSGGIWNRFIASQPASGVVATENTVDVYVGQLTSICYVCLDHTPYFEVS